MKIRHTRPCCPGRFEAKLHGNAGRRDIAIIAGQKTRDKRVSIAGISEADLFARLSALLTPAP